MSSDVTVVIPTKDRADLLAVTLRSVVAQRDVEVDVVVVDDGGVPGVDRVVHGIVPDARVLRHERSRGVSAARNHGLAEARTPWVAFLDDDDLWAAGKLSRQLRAAEGSDCRWVCSTAVTFNAVGDLLGVQHAPQPGQVLDLLLASNPMPGGGSDVVVDTELMREVGGFDEGLASLADWDCWTRLSAMSPLATVASADVGYRIHATSMLHDNAKSERELAVLLDKHAALRAQRGVAFDRESWDYARERLAYSGGHWREGVRCSWVLATRHRQPSAAVKPLVELLPAAVHERRRRRRLAPDAALLTTARTWLSDYVPA